MPGQALAKSQGTIWQPVAPASRRASVMHPQSPDDRARPVQ